MKVAFWDGETLRIIDAAQQQMLVDFSETDKETFRNGVPDMVLTSHPNGESEEKTRNFVHQYYAVLHRG